MMHQISEIQFRVQDDSRIKYELENDYNNYHLKNLVLLDLCACSLPIVNNLLFYLDIFYSCPEIYHIVHFLWLMEVWNCLKTIAIIVVV